VGLEYNQRGVYYIPVWSQGGYYIVVVFVRHLIGLQLYFTAYAFKESADSAHKSHTAPVGSGTIPQPGKDYIGYVYVSIHHNLISYSLECTTYSNRIQA
jgi:hypothetical protein